MALTKYNSLLRPSRTEWYSFIILMPLMSLVLGQLLFGTEFFTEWNLVIRAFPAIMFTGLLSWYAHVVSMHWLAKKFPAMEQTTKRLLLLALTHGGLICVTMIGFFYGYAAIGFGEYAVRTHNMSTGIWSGLILVLFATTLWEVEYLFAKWKASLVEKERVERQQLQQEFENLKKQINPHFLFNSLNTLSSLIDDDPVRADRFLHELSIVYRYLLKNNQPGICTLKDELHFIESYFRLLQIRFGDAVAMEINVASQWMNRQIPSLTLQLLVENVVKHNVITKSHPLVIRIEVREDGWLRVTNTLKQKPANILSGKVGLANIALKYRLLNEPEPVIETPDGEFSVRVRLLNENNEKPEL